MGLYSIVDGQDWRQAKYCGDAVVGVLGAAVVVGSALLLPFPWLGTCGKNGFWLLPGNCWGKNGLRLLPPSDPGKRCGLANNWLTIIVSTAIWNKYTRSRFNQKKIYLWIIKFYNANLNPRLEAVSARFPLKWLYLISYIKSTESFIFKIIFLILLLLNFRIKNFLFISNLKNSGALKGRGRPFQLISWYKK